MATVTELTLFKACVEDPKVITNLMDLNCARTKDPNDAHHISEDLYLQKKSLKLFHMVWSGVTKYIKTVVQGRCKPIEFPHLGIFLPMSRMED